MNLRSRKLGGRARLALRALLCLVIIGFAGTARGADLVPFAGEKSSWHGFDRYDFLMDETDLTIKPYKVAPDEKNAIKAQVKGFLRCVVVVPKEAAAGNPWSWQGYYFDHEPQAEVELLKRGFHIGHILIDCGKEWEAWYAFLTEKHGLSKTPAFVGMSRGGRNEFTWATTHPDKVSCIYADNPGISPDSLSKFGKLAKYDVPILQVCGSLDPILANYALTAENVYRQMGGRVSMMIKDGTGHHPHSLRDPKPIADFIESSQQPVKFNPPAAVDKTYTRTSFYGIESTYRDYPSQGLYITCRGPWFGESYDRYEFKMPGAGGQVTIIAPKTAAPGTPWVFRGDNIQRDAVIDLALLGKGFHIVVGPVSSADDAPVVPQWNNLYKHLVANGFAKKPVMAGARSAASVVYAWAVENPDKVSCIYGENPAPRLFSKTQPLDNLAPLAKAGVPLLHVCSSLDPWLGRQTRVAEKRYRELGGQMTVLVNEGEGNSPLAPKDRAPVVDFIVKYASH